MLDKLEAIKIKYKDLEQQLSDAAVVADAQRFRKVGKEYRDLEPIVDAYEKYKNLLSNITFNKQVVAEEKDEELKEMAKMELDEQLAQLPELEEEIRLLLIPKDPEDDKNAILEIRAGTGGDEASIFAGDLLKMYLRYCDSKGWKTEIMNENPGTSGGFKEVVVEVNGDGVYGILKYESGVHRVQRVPETESQGRVHTSAATVAVLPEAEEVDVEIKESDIRRDVYRASGAGGQHVNRTESAVRLTHIPTGTVAECQDGRSQIKNYESALKVLRTRLYEAAINAHNDAIAKQRKTLVSTGDRSAKIRTYNYPQGRVTDHRINLTLYNLGEIVNGDLNPIIDKLIFEENAEKLKMQNMH
ncbi:MAG TPA: peptide chain release factor 1 [Chitinophagales bacterium]|nr:peptide chain release factor 1 [Chitinophagales bacterium]MCB9074320.1 peptide chain release factor 1 [Chitinophagales bacterium]HMU97587.1 peptide chain release factor 1 [Chitinophagales bacterium]HMV02454.1 peptide chain release factor 1 [Chitinophagales bacterium]HMW93630.1 peptide chain release factor 1 [Chitinophagales bacterium]